MRRHIVALAVIMIVAIGTVYQIHQSRVPYEEGSTVYFTIPSSTVHPNPYSVFTGDLVDVAGVMAQIMMSPQAQDQVRRAGGLATYDLALYNLYNEDYPNYSDPYLTFTVTGSTPQQVQKTYAVVAAQLDRTLVYEQARYGAIPHNQIRDHIVGDSGVISLHGSKMRTYAALIVLTIIIIFIILRFLDRRQLSLLERMHARSKTGSARRFLRYRPQPDPAHETFG